MNEPQITSMSTPPPTPETDAIILSRNGFGLTQYEWREHGRRLERERDEVRRNAEVERLSGVAVVAMCKRQESEIEAMREAIKEGHDALTECVDDSGELLAERGWWQDEPRCDYQIRYDEHKQRIEAAKAALTKLQPFIKP